MTGKQDHSHTCASLHRKGTRWAINRGVHNEDVRHRIVAEALIKFLRSRKTDEKNWHENPEIMPYFFAILNNCLIDYYREVGRRPAETGLEDARAAIDHHGSQRFQSRLRAFEDRDELNRAAEEAFGDDADTWLGMLLLHEQGYTNREIAEERAASLKQRYTSESGVANARHRAKVRLRAILRSQRESTASVGDDCGA